MRLSENHKQVLMLLSNGCTREEAGKAMGRGTSYVYQSCYLIRKKLNVSTNIEAVARAIREGHIQ